MAVVLVLSCVTVSAQVSDYVSVPTHLCENGDWVYMWGDEFNGTTLDTSKWITYSNNGCYDKDNDDCVDARVNWGGHLIYKDENVVVQNGKCTLYVKVDPYSEWKGVVFNHSGAVICTRNNAIRRDIYKRGKLVARIKMSGQKNVWNTFWIWGAKKWVKTSEIDIAEYNGNNPHKMTYSLHNFPENLWWDDTETHKKSIGLFRYHDWSTAFHDYMVEWDENFIKFFIDGSNIKTIRRIYSPPDFVISTEDCNILPGNYAYHEGFFDINEFGNINFTLALVKNWMISPRAEMVIDYVRLYQRNTCQDNSVIPSSKLFPFEELNKNSIILGTQNFLRPWSNIIPQWETGQYRANSITMLPNFISYPEWVDPTPDKYDDPQNNHYSSFEYIAGCQETIPPMYIIPPSEEEDEDFGNDSLFLPCYNVDTVYLDSLIYDALVNDNTEFINEIQAYLDTLGCEWWPEYSNKSSMSLNDMNRNSIAIYPNPSDGYFNICFPASGNFVVEIIDMLGKTVYIEQTNYRYKMEVNTGLPAGTYAIQIKDKYIYYRSKITVNK